MDYSSSSLDKQYLLHTPMAFVLQKYTLKEIEQVYDENGWNILHQVVADANIPKITELLHFSFDIKLNTTKNLIPLNIYVLNEKKKQEKVSFFSNIPFAKNGFTAPHLAMFLFHFYSQLSEDFFYQNLADKYKQILSLLITEQSIKEIKDKSSHSLFDYAFLLENISLIDFMHMKDTSFSSLSEINPQTAKKIIEVMTIKYKDGSHQHMIDFLQKKILKDSLEQDLKKNEYSSNKTVNKI